MQVKNFYPGLPEVPYKKIAVPQPNVINYISSLQLSTNIKRIAYAVSYNETAGFTALVNTNAAGFQADNGRWAQTWDKYITATTVKNENMTGNARRFLVFNTWQSSILMLATSLNARGIYIGGDATIFAGISPIQTVTELYTAYYRGWVLGDNKANPKQADINDFAIIYNKAEKIFI